MTPGDLVVHLLLALSMCSSLFVLGLFVVIFVMGLCDVLVGLLVVMVRRG